MVRMRFAADALAELRKIDPHTRVTLRFIRRLMDAGTIPTVTIGNGKRRLLNFDALLAYLDSPTEPEPEPVHGVRKIEERVPQPFTYPKGI